MSRLVLYMSMSLDGCISGPGDDMDNPFGAGGERLHDWLRDDGPKVAPHRPSAGPSQVVFDEMMATGAVVTGRRTGDFVGYWGGDHHDGVPIHVLTHHVDEGDVPPGSAKFYTDVVACATEARAAAVRNESAGRTLLRPMRSAPWSGLIERRQNPARREPRS